MPVKNKFICKCFNPGLWQVLFLTIALILVVLGFRLMLIEKWAVDLPYWDQWEGELRNLILPYLDGTLEWHHFFSAHNEHRILWSRLITLALFIENSQWDNLLEVTFNCFLQCLGSAALFLAGRKLFYSYSIYLWWMVVAIAGCLPFGFENTMMGFQSQFYLMGLFTVLTLWVGSREDIKPYHKALAVGFLCFMLLFTMGSGFLCPLVLIVALLLKGTLKDGFTSGLKKELPVLLTLLAGVVAGFVLLPHVPQHDYLKADGIGKLWIATGRYFSWPWSGTSGEPGVHFCMAIIIWLPSLVYLCFLGLNRQKIKADDVFVLALVGWAALQALGMAYSRGGSSIPFPASRYADTLIFGVVANFLALWRTPTLLRDGPFWTSGSFAFSLVWLGTVAVGLTSLTMQNIRHEVPYRSNNFVLQAVNVSRFVQDGDERHLIGKPGHELPFPQAEVLVDLLKKPAVKQILPWGVRTPLAITERLPSENSGFANNGFPGKFDRVSADKIFGSFSKENGSVSQGLFQGEFINAGTLPYIGFKVAGHLHEGGSTFEIRSLSKKSQKLTANDRAAETWSMVYLKSRGAGLYEVRASDKSETRWLAFSEPREIGRLSMYARILLEQYPWILLAGLGLFCVVAYGGAWRVSYSKEAMQ